MVPSAAALAPTHPPTDSRAFTVPAAFDAAGHLVYDQRRFDAAALRLGLTHPGSQAELTLRLRRRPRSTQQNARYWALCHEWAELAGYDRAEDLHEDLKAHFLGLEFFDTPLGDRVPRVRSTTTLSTAEFCDYVDKAERLMRRMHG